MGIPGKRDFLWESHPGKTRGGAFGQELEFLGIFIGIPMEEWELQEPDPAWGKKLGKIPKFHKFHGAGNSQGSKIWEKELQKAGKCCG